MSNHFFLDRAGPQVYYAVRRHVVRQPMHSLPLSEPVLLILFSLAEQPRHGYSILKDVQEMSDGRVTLSTGTLYGALHRLLEDGWIERFEEVDRFAVTHKVDRFAVAHKVDPDRVGVTHENRAPRGRRAYRLTPAGRRNLQGEVTRLQHLTRLAGLRVAALDPGLAGVIPEREA